MEESIKLEHEAYIAKKKRDNLAVWIDSKSPTSFFFREDENSFILTPNYVTLGEVLPSGMEQKYTKDMQAEEELLSKSEWKLEPCEFLNKKEIISEYQEDYVTPGISFNLIKGDVVLKVKVKGKQAYFIYADFINKYFADYKNVILLPEEVGKIEILESSLLNNGVYYIWRDKEFFYLYKENSKLMLQRRLISVIKLPISYIEYYDMEGEVRYEHNVHGNITGNMQGGGSSVGKAVLWGIAGDLVGGPMIGCTSAVIGSRREVSGSIKGEIKTDVNRIDERVLYIKIRDENNTNHIISINPDDKKALDWFIPDKEFNYVVSKRRSNIESFYEKSQDE